MKVLVTGGAGFIGSHLTERLLKDGHAVIVLDDLSTGLEQNLKSCAGHPSFEFRKGSALDASLVKSLVTGCDVIFHLAAAVGVRRIVDHPIETMAVNVNASQVILEAAAHERTRVFLASSSEVYGRGISVPFREDADLRLGPTTQARWSYACAKAMDEWLGFAYHQERDVPVTIVRFFNTAGPRQLGRYGMVLPTLAKQAVLGEPLTVFGSGTQTRCFADVDEVVESLLLLLATDESIGEVFNVGSDHEVSIQALAELVREVACSGSSIVTVPYEEAYSRPLDDLMRRVPDVQKLERVTGYRLQTPLRAIVTRVVDSCRAELGEDWCESSGM